MRRICYAFIQKPARGANWRMMRVSMVHKIGYLYHCVLLYAVSWVLYPAAAQSGVFNKRLEATTEWDGNSNGTGCARYSHVVQVRCSNWSRANAMDGKSSSFGAPWKRVVLLWYSVWALSNCYSIDKTAYMYSTMSLCSWIEQYELLIYNYYKCIIITTKSVLTDHHRKLLCV